MKPIQLMMQAFGSYRKKTVVDFTCLNQRIFLITGDTGAGKTTIFDAIVFALYGEASSGMVKKDGTELQSQYASEDVEPYTELVFSEQEGEETAIYRVRRTPRHVRPLKRGKGFKEESETVSLLMPDGTEYPQKETNRKLEEIVGLTKSQFMQVAMIAQGEFMNLLRAKSDDKKVIFRKLFHTEIYQKIVNELVDRRKAKDQEMDRIRTACQTEISHLDFSEEGEERGGLEQLEEVEQLKGLEQLKEMEQLKGLEQLERLKRLKDRILNARELSVTDLEELQKELEVVCPAQKEKKEKAEKEYKQAEKAYLQQRDACQKGQEMQNRFRELDQAQEMLEKCREEEGEIREADLLLQRWEAARDIGQIWKWYEDAAERRKDAQRRLADQEESLPGLEKLAEQARQGEEAAKKKQEKAGEAFARISQRVETGLKQLEQLEAARKAVSVKQRKRQDAEQAAENVRQKLAELEIQEKEWKELTKRLADTDALLERWKNRKKEADRLEGELEDLERLAKERKQQKRADKKAREAYRISRENFDRKNSQYLSMRAAFLDAQAGFLAREQLRPGQPCPVCGSLDHPHPCRLEEEDQLVSREDLERAEKEVSHLQQEQEELAAQAGSAKQLAEEKDHRFRENLKKQAERIAQVCCLSEEDGKTEEQESGEALIPQWKNDLEKWRESLREEEKRLRKDAADLDQADRFLKEAEEQKRQLRAGVERADREAAQARAAQEEAEKSLKQLEASRDYPDRESAKADRSRADLEKKQADQGYRKAEEEARGAEQALQKAQTLQMDLQKQLPDLQKEEDKKRKAYETGMEEKGLTEAEWRKLAQEYGPEEIQNQKQKIQNHKEKRARAEQMKVTAVQAIGDAARPDPEQLQEALSLAQARYEQARSFYERSQELYRTNNRVREALLPKARERNRIVGEYETIQRLYKLLAGKETGARMDIETYVQRYYLERILQAANQRFLEMSAGQFELRLYGLEKAGEGKNHGLDLMVYSYITGKERAVWTLSGGESFMAALSLALGMADQIQESSAAVNLDVMFIDEGFGSLDEHARGQAVRILQQMAGNSRMIGIISHVSELKQEIEDQLLVSKDEEGSHVRWQIS